MSITGRGRFNIVVTDEYGNIAPGASVEIRTETGLALTDLFTNRNGTGARANPLTADENGYAFAYAATGHYQIKLSVYGRERILRDVEIGVTYSPPREPLTANRAYYVRTDGNNNNSGLANSAGGAFLTVKKAIDTALALDPGIHTVTIFVGTGTFTTAFSNASVTQAMVGNSELVITGATGTAASHVLLSEGGLALNASDGARVRLKNLTLETSGASSRLYATRGAVVSLDNVRFDGTSRFHIETDTGAVVRFDGNTTMLTGCTSAVSLSIGAMMTGSSRTTTVVGTPAFSAGYIQAATGAVYNVFNHTYTGGATGRRYLAATNGVIQTFGKGEEHFPGSTAGQLVSGGQYA